MAKPQGVNAIDIGSGKITCLITVPSGDEGDKLNLVGAATVPSRGVKKGQIVNIEDVVSSISDCVESAERMAGFNIDSAFVTINGDHIQCQNSPGLAAVSESGEINSDDIQRVMEGAKAVSLPTSREIIHALPREFIVDGQRGIKDPTSMSGMRLETEAHLITGLSPAIKNVTRCVQDLGINVSGVVYTGLASSYSVLSETEKDLGVILADIGAGTTSISIFTEGTCCYSATLPVGARKITDDIAIGLTSSIDSAERIKFFLSKPKEGRDTVEKQTDEIDFSKLGVREENLKTGSRKAIVEGIIRPRLNEIFTLIRDVIKQSGFEGQTPAGIVLTGGGSLTVGIAESARRVLQLPPRVGLPSGLSGVVAEVGTPEYSAAVGLILYGYQSKPQNFSGGAKLTGIFKKVPGHDVAGKALEFIKSFLP